MLWTGRAHCQRQVAFFQISGGRKSKSGFANTVFNTDFYRPQSEGDNVLEVFGFGFYLRIIQEFGFGFGFASHGFVPTSVSDWNVPIESS